MNSKIIMYLITLLICCLASSCVRVPAKSKKPEAKKVILVNATTEAPGSILLS